MSNKDAAFWDRIAKRYAASPISDQASYEHKLALTRRYLREDMTAVEFGCGTGSTALLHAPCVARYLASDVSPRMIEIAQGKLRDDPVDGLEFRVGTLQDLALPDNSQDAVLGLNILHLLADVPAALEEVARILRPGGVFVSSTAVLRDTMPWFRPLGFIGSRLGLIPRITMLRQAELVALHEKTGLDILERWQPSAKSHTVFLVARAAGVHTA